MIRSLRAHLPIAAVLLAIFLTTPIAAQQSDTLPYLNPDLPVDQRVDDLVGRMTLEEKASQVVHQAAAIPRLKVPAYNWWTEALHGVASGTATVFPEPIGLAATFDPPLIHEMAVVDRQPRPAPSTRGHPPRQLHRSWPRLLVAQHQHLPRPTLGTRPGNLRRRSVPHGSYGRRFRYRHAGRRSQILSRHRHTQTLTPSTAALRPPATKSTCTVSRHDEEDTYLPAFRASVTEAKAGSVMCAYNSINGEPACANQFLLEDQLRSAWKFQGYVVSDCGAVARHPGRPPLRRHAARGRRCGNPPRHGSGMQRPRLLALRRCREEWISERGRTRHSRQAPHAARMQLGMFDPPALVKYAQIPFAKMTPNAPPTRSQSRARIHGAA